MRPRAPVRPYACACVYVIVNFWFVEFFTVKIEKRKIEKKKKGVKFNLPPFLLFNYNIIIY